MEKYSKMSGDYFQNGYCCAESVLLAVAEAYNIKSDLIPKIATGFCTGIAKTDSLCGAMTGGILGINVLTGRTEPNADRTENYELIQDLTEYFRENFKELSCKGVCGHDLATLEGQEAFEKAGAKSHCTSVVINTTLQVLELLKEHFEIKRITTENA
ncbi:MAG: C-GCAxxG-C-C family protein [Bacteroidetes bacterium]|nr:C-GCAxxG-C-C family protein [Bacteroidota bacterium]